MGKKQKTLCVIPAESFVAYAKKGEIKERYYNPENFFDIIHIITFTDPSEAVDLQQAKRACGDAKVFVHKIGMPKISDFYRYRKKIFSLIHKIQPDIIRAFSPRLAGYCGIYAGKKLGIPTVVSLHGDEDRDVRYQYWVNKDYRRLVKSLGFRFLTEKYAIQNADKVICAYQFPISYAKRFGAKEENIVLVYNRVDTKRFSPPKRVPKKQFTVICVGRLIKEKNQECLIRALQYSAVNLLLIGDGEEYDFLVSLAKELGVEKRVTFIRSVPHSQIEEYYKKADVFAIAIKYGGVAIPVLEAMASGLPVVVPKPIWEEEPEFVGKTGLVVPNDPKSFADAFKRLMEDKELYMQLSRDGRKKALSIDQRAMEKKEANVYRDLL